jgi:hypothetical protein
MANRVLRRDQADWVDVRRVLGSPDRHRLGVLRDLAAGANRALKEGTLDPDRLRDELADSGWAAALAEARETLRARLAAATAGPDDETTPATTTHQQPDDKEAEPVTTVDEAPAAARAVNTKEGFLRALETSAAADRTCKKHEAVRHALMSELLWADLAPADSPTVDVSCAMDDGLFVYEVLGAGRSAYADLRSGATRLLEINHTLPEPAVRLCLVLCEPPVEDWSADTVREVFGVHVLWRTRAGWGGDGTRAALGGREQ